jgi:hypothetical protein
MSPTIDLTFDPELHLYAYKGEPMISVTRVLADAGLVDYSFCSDFAMWRGSEIHKALHVELDHRRGLDWSTVPDAFHPYIFAAKEYIASEHAEVLEVERRVVSTIYRFAGTLDAVLKTHAKCGCGRRSVLALCDWKSGPPVAATALQLAGYACAYFEETKTLIHERRSVHLKQTGEAYVKVYTERTDRDDFLSGLRVATFRRKHGLLREAA